MWIARQSLNELSLFTGAGGGLLGTKLLGFKNIGYIEKDDYCQRIIAQRIRDGILDEAPIFGDIRTFISEGFAASYTGMVDVLTGGFPCQPFSITGKNLGEKDPRNLWPETIECIRIIRPRFAFLENVPNILCHDYVRRIFGDLAESGYDARWCVLGAGHIGGVLLRKRLWIFAFRHSNSERLDIIPFLRKTDFKNHFWDDCTSGCLYDAFRDWEISHGRVCGVDNGLAVSVDRLRAIGNGQVPQVVEAVWKMLSDGMSVEEE